MKRRDFLIATGAAGGALLLPRMSFGAEGVIDWYTSSDSNILDFWANNIKPAYEASSGGTTVNLIDGGDGSGLNAIADRAMAAMQSNTDPQADMFESHDALYPIGGIDGGLWVNFRESGISNLDRVNPLAWETDFGLPYRGSQVLLAYDSSKLTAADAPKNWDDLVTWIKANPGAFTYNRPDGGGSGGNFVRRAIHEANGRDPSAFTIDNFTPEFAEEALAGAWDILADIAPSLYDGGSYSAGNTQSIQLLAQGVVTMVPVWSDQVLQAISQGVLPENTGLVQLQDLALAGGFSRMTVFNNGVNRDAAIELANYALSDEVQTAILTELGGFPGVSWDFLPDELRERFADIVPTSIPTFPGGDWGSAINDGWYRNVAPTLEPAS
jgi:putative spermidine/putrescine transport system substrate-binding protein